MNRLFSLCALLALFSCTPDHDDDPAAPATVCQLSHINLFESPAPDDRLLVVYEAGQIKEIKSSGFASRFSYNASGQLIKKELLNGSTTVSQVTTYSYDGGGKLVEVYEKDNSSSYPDPDNRFVYSYANGKISEVTAYIMPATVPAFKQVFTWTGDNITSIAFYEGSNLVCADSFTYDLSKANSFYDQFKYFYWQDPMDDYELFKEVWFFSRNLPVTSSAQCASWPAHTMGYTYNTKGMVKNILVDQDTVYSFRYTCD